MKVEIEHAAFHELISRAARALANRSALPVLAGPLLRAEDDVLRASAFDFELTVRTSSPASVASPDPCWYPAAHSPTSSESCRSCPSHS